MQGKLARQSRVDVRVDVPSQNWVYLDFNSSVLYLNLDTQLTTWGSGQTWSLAAQ